MTNSSSNGTIIETRGITKVYKGNGVEVRAVRGIDLVIERGDFAAIVGPSGSGKTTDLRVREELLRGL